jgi:FkbM family methyltransferase
LSDILPGLDTLFCYQSRFVSQSTKTLVITKDFLLDICPRQLRLPLRFHYWKCRGKLENEILLLKKLVGKGRRAIDIGANEGIYSYALSKLCEVVEVFEPQPWCAEIVTAYSEYRRKNINVYKVGLSASKGKLILNIPLVDGKPQSYLATFRDVDCNKISLEVPVNRLDDYDFTDVSFIKIDVEGHESNVINGSRKTLLREKPTLLVEIEQRHLGSKPIEAVFNEIADLGYEGSFLYKGRLIPLSEFSYNEHQHLWLKNHQFKLDNNKSNSYYVNNFIFSPSS